MPAKEVRVIIKEVVKNTLACNACRVRKGKCDGKFPCSYCIAKNITCEFAERKKRGPVKKRRLNDTETEPTSTALVCPRYEAELLDQAEARHYSEFYLKFMNMMMPLTSRRNMMEPQNTAHKVQAYAALAHCSCVLGNYTISQKYITQARLLGGAIYDSEDADAASAMLMISNYGKLVLDTRLCVHFTNMACSIADTAPPHKISGSLRAFCQISSIMNTLNITTKQRAALIASKSNELLQAGLINRPMSYFLTFAANVLDILGFNVWCETPTTISHVFQAINKIHISEVDRVKLLQIISVIVIDCQSQAVIDGYPCVLFANVFGPMYKGIVEWKSGHIAEGLENTIACLSGLRDLQHADIFGILADFSHICILGNLAKYLQEYGHNNLAIQMCGFMKKICNLMKPAFDFILELVDKFIDMALGRISSSTFYQIITVPSISTPPSFFYSSESFFSPISLHPYTPISPASPVSPASPASPVSPIPPSVSPLPTSPSTLPFLPTSPSTSSSSFASTPPSGSSSRSVSPLPQTPPSVSTPSPTPPPIPPLFASDACYSPNIETTFFFNETCSHNNNYNDNDVNTNNNYISSCNNLSNSDNLSNNNNLNSDDNSCNNANLCNNDNLCNNANSCNIDNVINNCSANNDCKDDKSSTNYLESFPSYINNFMFGFPILTFETSS